jgi:hypothetical protein
MFLALSMTVLIIDRYVGQYAPALDNVAMCVWNSFEYVYIVNKYSVSVNLIYCIASSCKYLLRYPHRKSFPYIQSVPGGKDNILGGHSIGHSKQKTLYEHVSYSERFTR